MIFSYTRNLPVLCATFYYIKTSNNDDAIWNFQIFGYVELSLSGTFLVVPWELEIVNVDCICLNVLWLLRRISTRRIYFLHFDWLEKFDFAAKYFPSQESRNVFYFFVAKYFGSSELLASWKSAFIAIWKYSLSHWM